MAYTYDKEGNLIDDSFPARIRRVWGPGEDSIWARGNKVLKTFQERPLTGFEQNLNNMVEFGIKNSPLGVEDESLEQLQKGTTGLAKRFGANNLASELLGGSLALMTGMVLPGPGEGQVINRAVTNINKLKRNVKPFDPGGRKRGFTAVERVTPDGRLAGQTKIDEFRTAVKSNASDDELAKILSTDYAGALDPYYLDGRRGYYNIERLVKDKELLNKVIDRQDEIAQLHYKWVKAKTKSAKSQAQRNFFEAVGDTYFNQDRLLYTDRSKWEKKIVDVANWVKGDQWHHVFGNREAAEFLMSAVARDPLVGVNLARLLQKEGLTAAGVARNLMVMPEQGHKQFHRFFKLLGGEPAGRTRGVMDFADFGQAIADAAQRGHTYGPKVFDPETGVSLAGKVIPPDPSLVNELFSMIKTYGKANRRFEQLIKQGEVWVDPKLKRIVPKGTKGAKRYDFKATVKDGGPNAPRKDSYLLSEKIGRLMKILDEP